MSTSRRKSVVALSVIAGLALILYFTLWREPHYQGKSVTTWFDEMNANDSDAYGRSADALRHLGVRAVPPLLEQLHYNSTTVRFKTRKFLSQHGIVSNQFFEDEPMDYQRKAIDALIIVGTNAVSAAPDLAGIFHQQGKLAMNALTALRAIGWEALKSLSDEAADPKADAKERIQILQAMGDLSTNGAPAVPTLITVLKDPAPTIRAAAAKSLGAIAAEPDKCVPLLVEALKDADPNVRTSAARALGGFRKQAASAVPALQKAAEDSQSSVSREAKRALKFINAKPGELLEPEGRGGPGPS